MVQAESRDVYLIQSDEDIVWVEMNIAQRLNARGVKLAFDRWDTIPGTRKLSELQKRLSNSKCCAACVGRNGLVGLSGLLEEAANDRAVNDGSYRLIPVLLPGATRDNLPAFLDRYAEVDFNQSDLEYSLHLLTAGINGEPPGPWPPPRQQQTPTPEAEQFERAKQILKATLDGIKAALEETLISQEDAQRERDRAFAEFRAQVRDLYSEERVTVKER